MNREGVCVCPASPRLPQARCPSWEKYWPCSCPSGSNAVRTEQSPSLGLWAFSACWIWLWWSWWSWAYFLHRLLMTDAGRGEETIDCSTLSYVAPAARPSVRRTTHCDTNAKRVQHTTQEPQVSRRVSAEDHEHWLWDGRTLTYVVIHCVWSVRLASWGLYLQGERWLHSKGAFLT